MFNAPAGGVGLSNVAYGTVVPGVNMTMRVKHTYAADGFLTAGIMKNTADGLYTGGNTLSASDLPVHSHTSVATGGDFAWADITALPIPVAQGGTGNVTGDASTLLTATWAAPGAIGSSTPNTAAFTTSSNVSVAAYESGALSAELLSAAGWTSIDWTGSYPTFDHTTGNTTALTNTLAASIGTYYHISYTIANRTAGSITIDFGGETSDSVSATGAWGPKATTVGSLSVTPTSTFDGDVTLSIKSVAPYLPTYKILDSVGSSVFEIRPNVLTKNNLFLGKDAGTYNTTGTYNLALGSETLKFNTTGAYNIGIGYRALTYVTVGNYNIAVGVNALRYTTSGYRNVAVGFESLTSNIAGYDNSTLGFFASYSNNNGYRNIAIGSYALFSNSDGYDNIAIGNSALYSAGRFRNVAIGRNAGRYIADGTTANVLSALSLYLGYNSMAGASGNTNEIVIGPNAIGGGSNTATIGDANITATYLKGTVTVPLDLYVNGGDFSSTATTFNLLNATVTTLNVGGAGIAISVGAATGYTQINNAAVKMPNLPTSNPGAGGGMWVDTADDYTVKMGHA